MDYLIRIYLSLTKDTQFLDTKFSNLIQAQLRSLLCLLKLGRIIAKQRLVAMTRLIQQNIQAIGLSANFLARQGLFFGLGKRGHDFNGIGATCYNKQDGNR